MRRLLRAGLLALPLLLGACASRAPQPVYTNPVLPLHWEAEGKAAVRNAERGTNLYFTWTQHGTDYRLVVRGPLGLGRAELQGRPGAVRLLADGMASEVSASSPEELFEMLTRRRAPVSSALHWMKAEPAGARARIERDPEGRPLVIREDGWTVRYLEWSEEAPRLPRRLTVEGPDGRATVVIGEWRLHLPARADALPASATAAACCDRQAAEPCCGAGPAMTCCVPGTSGAGAGATPDPSCCAGAASAAACCPPPARDPATVLPLAPLDKLPDPGL